MPEGISVGGDNNAIDTTDANWDDYIIGPAAPALTLDEPGFRRIKFELYDSTNTLINLTNAEKNAIISKWIGTRTSSGYYSGYNSTTNTHDGNANNLQFLVKQEQEDEQWYCTDVAVRTQPGLPITSFRYIILSAAVKQSATSTYNDNEYDVGPVNFVQMLPLHIRKEDSYSINGADFITYDDNGANPQCFNDEYKLDNFEGEKFRIVVDDNDVAVLENNIPRYKTTYKWYPHLDEDDKLVPCQIYVDDLSRHIAVEAFENINGTPTLYTMPILMVQNRYQIPAINSWNGELLIDEEGNRIMAATIAAGHKDNENRFTGVIMGDVERKDPTTNRDKLTSGLFGYNTGAESFGFLSDGTGFIGKTGTGRIEFDGNNGYIRSANYNITKRNNAQREGSEIDLQNGSIDMWGLGYSWSYDENTEQWTKILPSGNTTLTSNVHIDTIGSATKPYFRVGVPVISNSGADADGLKSLIRIDNNNYYLQTADYGATGKGLKIDLKNGTFDSKGKLTINGGAGSSINFGNGTFTVNANGSIHATSGDIGGWEINTHNLHSGHMYIDDSGSMRGLNWYINSDGTSSFGNGNSNTYGSYGFSSAGGCSLVADNGYFGGTIVAEKLILNGRAVNFSSLSFVTGDITINVDTKDVDVAADLTVGTNQFLTGISDTTFSTSVTPKGSVNLLTGNFVGEAESHSHRLGGGSSSEGVEFVYYVPKTLHIPEKITLSYNLTSVTVLNAGVSTPSSKNATWTASVAKGRQKAGKN